jgi:hypothetical protein
VKKQQCASDTGGCPGCDPALTWTCTATWLGLQGPVCAGVCVRHVGNHVHIQAAFATLSALHALASRTHTKHQSQNVPDACPLPLPLPDTHLEHRRLLQVVWVAPPEHIQGAHDIHDRLRPCTGALVNKNQPNSTSSASSCTSQVRKPYHEHTAK